MFAFGILIFISWFVLQSTLSKSEPLKYIIFSISQYVESWMSHWVGCVEESVFDVNMLVIDEQNVVCNNENDTVFQAFEKHGITPQGIKKAIKDIAQTTRKEEKDQIHKYDNKDVREADRKRLLQELEAQYSFFPWLPLNKSLEKLSYLISWNPPLALQQN